VFTPAIFAGQRLGKQVPLVKNTCNCWTRHFLCRSRRIREESVGLYALTTRYRRSRVNEVLLETSFSVRSASCQRKVRDNSSQNFLIIFIIKAKFLWLTKLYTMKTYEGVEVYIHVFLTSALIGVYYT
jgi:hypothetical protein